jgi:succinoglycan biosynthesis transport protein ExoP
MEIFDRPLLADKTHATSSNDTADLRETFVKLWARKKLILASTLICAVLAFVIAKLITPTYTGEALVMVTPQQPAGDSTVLAGILGNAETMQSEAFVLQSRFLASETIERLRLDRDPEFDPSLRKPNPLLSLLNPVLALFGEVQSWLRQITEGLLGATDAPAPSDELAAGVGGDTSAIGKPSTAVVDTFMKKLHVDVQQRSNVIRVSFNSSRATTAAVVPNTLIALYLERRIDAKEKARAQENAWLDKTLLDLRRKMRASELALADYRQKSGLVSDQNSTVLGQELSDIKGQLAFARARRAEATTRLNQIQALLSSPGTASPATASESAILQRLREQEIDLQGQLTAALKGSLGPNHPKTLQLAAKLSEVKDGIRREGAGFVGRLRAELAAAEATEAALNRRAAEYTREFAQVNGGDIELAGLMGEAEADRKIYERYSARSNEAHNSVGNVQPDASLVSSAGVPLKPSSVGTRTLLMVGAMLGVGAGIVLATMIDVLVGGMRSKEQVEEALGIGCLGLVPRLKRSSRNLFRAPQLQSAIQSRALLQPPNTRFGQAIRGVQLKLLGSIRRTGSCVVLVTAALPEEGKTWVAVSLAASLAADGFSVVLVDCDLHRSKVHQMFGGTRGPGLTDYFAGDAAFDEIVRDDPGSRVHYVAAGAALSKDALRVTADRLCPLVDRLSERHAFIVLDSAPVLAVAETALLSQIAQKTIFVVRWRKTPQSVARHAVTQLLESGSAEIAVLLSMVDSKRAAKGGDAVAGLYKRLENYYRCY